MADERYEMLIFPSSHLLSLSFFLSSAAFRLVQNAVSVEKLLRVIDKANGCTFNEAIAAAGAEGELGELAAAMQSVGRADQGEDSEFLSDIKEKYLHDEDEQLYRDMMEAAKDSEHQ